MGDLVKTTSTFVPERFDEMKRAIVACYEVDEVSTIRNQAEAYRYALRQANEAPEIIRKAEEIKLRAERRAGELLKDVARKPEDGRPKEVSNGSTLTDMGISRDQSSKWQKIASIPEDKFEGYLGSKDELTTAGALRLAKSGDWYQSSASDDWWTPQWVFDMLDQEFGFETDVCASADNAKCQRFFSREDNALEQEWTGVCWMNPPYGRSGDQGIYQWMQKAHQSAQRGATVVCLVPSRTDPQWWWDHALEGEIRFIKGRLKFSEAANSAPFPQAVVILRPGLPDNGQVVWWGECQQP